jgi:hypothetical protein
LNLKTWKDYLLRSGLPLENDVKKMLADRGCVGSYEYSYLKEDENVIKKEFSYDVDAAYIKGIHFFEFMIECKYRHESTKWVFTPASYGGFRELYSNDFLHANDHFVSHRFPFKGYFPITFAPACGKGVELTTNGDNDKTIVQAIHQLAYAFAEKFASAFEHAIFNLLAGEHIFYHIPIIVTTADLWRLKEETTITEIKKASDLSEIAEQHNILIMENTTGVQLEQFNNEVFDKFRERVGDKKLQKKLNTYTDDLDHFFSVISKHYCPAAFVVMKYDEHGTSFDKLFNYINQLLQPDVELKEKLLKQARDGEKMAAEIDEMLKGAGILDEIT